MFRIFFLAECRKKCEKSKKRHSCGRRASLAVLVGNGKLKLPKNMATNRHSRSAAALKPAWGAGFNAAALREWRFFDFWRKLEIVN